MEEMPTTAEINRGKIGLQTRKPLIL